MSKETREDFVIPGTRDEFLAEWREDPKAILEKAEKADLSLEGYANSRAPATQESPGSTMEWLLFNEGVRTQDTLQVPSTRLEDLPDLDPVNGQHEPLSRAVIAHCDEVYNQALITGTRASAALSPLTVNGGWRPTYDEAPVRSPQIAPGFNFLEVVAMTRGIREDKYRVRRWKNDSDEQKMQKLAEGTEPKLFEITRDKTDVSLNNYRAGIEWTDEFANDAQTRFADLTNAIEEIAIGHRIVLLQDLGRLIHDSVPSGNTYTTSGQTVAGVTATAGQLEYPFWVKFMKDFGNAYIPNVTLGNPTSITSLELMSMTAGNQNITYGSWAMVPNSNIRNLNGDLTQMSYGYISGDTATGFGDTELFTFQRETTLVFVMRLGMDQDEMERVPGPRKTRRWLGAQSAFAVSDPEGIRSINYA